MVNPKLTPQLIAFVEHFTGDCEGNGARSAQAAGIASAKSAKVMASRWLKRADVREAIVNRQAEIVNQRKAEEARQAAERQTVERAKIADAAERRERLTSILRRAGKNPVAAIKAADVLNKMDGLYITKLADPKGKPLIPPGSAFAFVVTQIPGAENRT